MNCSSHYLECEGREIHYTQWGADHPSTVLAWHGLARTGRDMDEIAAQLSSRYRVICPDTIGRGLSQWSPAPDPERHRAATQRSSREPHPQLRRRPATVRPDERA